MMVRSVAVLGAGHGGCAAAAYLGRRGYRVRLHARNAARLAPLRAQGGIEARGIVQGLVAIDLMTTDLAQAISGADLIMLVVPGVAHAHYARTLAIGDEPLVDCRDASGGAVPEAGARRGSVSGTFFHAISTRSA